MASKFILLLIIMSVLYTNEIDPNIDTTKKNLIITVITNYNWNKIAIFFNSIKMTKIQNCDVVAIVANMPKETIDKLKSCGVKVYLMKEEYISKSIANSKWKSIIDYLDANPNKYKYVFTADTKDVFFQDDPFKYYSLEKSYLGIAVEDGTLNESNNKRWIINAYGKEKYKSIKSERILCFDTVWGTVDKFYEFAKLMSDNLNKDWAGEEHNIIEQWVGNYLIYYDKKFNDCLVKSDNDNGYIMTLGLTDSDGMIIDSNNTIRNRKGEKVAVVHQYDRHQDLTNQAITKYYFDPEDTSIAISPNKKNLILGIVKDYNWEQISTFFISINNTKFENCDIVIYISNVTQDIQDKIKSCGVTVYQMEEKYKKESLITSKYKIAMDYLDANINKYNYVFTGDVRVIYFQQDPFKYYSLERSYLGIAVDDIIIYTNINYKSFLNKYNKDKYREIKNEYLILTDMVWGTVDKFYAFSKIMLNSIGTDLSNEIDQIVGNCIIYYEKLFNDCLIKSKRFDGYVISLEFPENQTIIMDNKLNDFIYNGQGRKAAVIHQYNIHKMIIFDKDSKNNSIIIITIIILLICFTGLFYYIQHLQRKNNIDFQKNYTRDEDEEKEEYGKKKKMQEMKEKNKIIGMDEDLDDDSKILNPS